MFSFFSNDKVKIVFTIVTVLLLLCPAVIGYAMKLKIEAISDFAISIYGLYSIVYFFVQVILVEKDSHRVDEDIKQRPDDWAEFGVGLVVVGYREEKDLLRRCLESIKNNVYSNIRRVIFIIDGNEDDDAYMADIYSEILNGEIIKVDFLVSENPDKDLSVFGQGDICIMQPHAGKREGLYTGFKLLIQDPSIQVIVTTDSDTILEKNSIKELAFQCHREEVGAVAGQILVWNTSESLLAHVVSYRYWMSFNLERAAESFWKTVLCVAGPMACYKVDILKQIMDEWYNQEFMGERCTFGDDRHLTNRVLKLGKKVVYTRHAVGWTDTPSNLGQYFRQQTRWSKSYFREFLFNLQSVHLHPLWMCYELCYHVVYFFLLMYWSLYILYFGSVFQQAVAVLITCAVAIMRSIYGMIKSGNRGFIFFYLYSFVYYFIIIPSKISGLVTLWDTNWGTRGFAAGWLYSYWSVIVWIGTLIGGFAYTIYKNHLFNIENEKYFIAFIGWMTFVGIVSVTLLVEFITRKFRMCSNYIEKSILEERKNLQQAQP